MSVYPATGSGLKNAMFCDVAFLEESALNIKAGSDASAAAWFSTAPFDQTYKSNAAIKRPKLAFDHAEINQKALEKLK